MQPISVEKFADMVMKNNKGYHKKELVKTLRETLAAKKTVARCMVCGASIWAAGSVITCSNLCRCGTNFDAGIVRRKDVIYNREKNEQANGGK